MEKLEITNVTLDDDFQYFYGDTKDATYGAYAETAYLYGLLPTPDSEGYEDPEQDIPLFEADKPATREYVAYTVAKALGFEGEYQLDCEDANEITYTSEVAVILQQKFLTVIDGKFLPQQQLVGTDKNRIFNKIDEFNQSLIVDPSETVDSVVLQENTIRLSDVTYSTIENTDGTYTVTLPKNEQTEQVHIDTVFILPASTEYVGGLSLKATEINTDGENLVMNCDVPEIEEVISEFDYAGNPTIDVSNMTVTDGIVASYDPNGTLEEEGDEVSPFDVGGSTALPGTLTYKLVDKDLDNGVKVTGKVSLEIPDITVKAKGKIWGGLSIDELTASITQEIKTECSLKYDFGVPETSYDLHTGNPTFGTGKIELTRIPIPLGTSGLSLDFVLFLNVDVSGTATIGYTVTSTNGFQYKDGAFRIIKDYDSSFNDFEVNASAELGAGIGSKISLFSVWDLAGMDAHAGLGLDVTFVPHLDMDPDLYCADTSIYLYAKMETNDDTLLAEILKHTVNISWSWDIFTKDNSPWKWHVHFENGKIVPTCTCDKGDISGMVKDASTGEAIGGARIKIYNASTNALVKTMESRPVSTTIVGSQVYKGEFLAQDLPAGEYRLDITATGYKTYSVNITVLKDQEVVCEAALMLLRSTITSDNGSVHGTITNALTGEQMSGVQYEVRKNWNVISGDTVYEGITSGTEYTISLAPGNYTVTFIKDDFVSVYSNIVVSSGADTLYNIAMTPLSGIQINSDSFRVVLTWGETPSDLDSHLYGMTTDGDVIYHTWYSYKSYDENDIEIANLDLDDTTSYGPETSTVYSMTGDEQYSFYVHDYSNRYSDYSMDMSYSGAQVKLYSGEQLIATFNVPLNREGTLWHVFDYNAATDEFKIVNELTYSEVG